MAHGGYIPPELWHCNHWQSQEFHTSLLWTHLPSWEEYIDTRNTKKSKKVAPYTTDITHLSCKVNCFEVSTKGLFNIRNHSTLNTLHRFVKPNITRPKFKSFLPSASHSQHPITSSCARRGMGAHLLRAPIHPPTLGDQEGYCLILIEYTCGVFCAKCNDEF